MKCKEPQLRILNNGFHEYDGITIRAHLQLIVELTCLDKSSIRYTLDDTFPTAHVGILVKIRKFHDYMRETINY